MEDKRLELHLAKMKAREEIYDESPSKLLKLVKLLAGMNREIYEIVSDNLATDNVAPVLEKIGRKLFKNHDDKFKIIGELNTYLDTLTDEEISCLIAQLNGRLASREVTRISLENNLTETTNELE